MVPVIWDIVALGVLVYFVGTGVSRGFVRTLVSLAGFLIALLVARYVGPLLADFLYDSVVRDAIELTLTQRLDAVLGGGAAPPEVAAAIPDGLSRLVQGDLLEIITEALLPEDGSLVSTLVDDVLREPVLALIGGLLFLLLFFLALFIVRHIARLFGGINRIPVVGTVNMLMGGIFGLLEASFVLLVLALALHMVILVSGGGTTWLSPEVLDATYILRVFYRLIPA